MQDNTYGVAVEITIDVYLTLQQVHVQYKKTLGPTAIGLFGADLRHGSGEGVSE